MARVCACGCGRSIEGRPAKTKFFDPGCRKAAFKARHGTVELPAQPDSSTVGRVRAELEGAGRAETYLGAAAIQLATRIDQSTAVMGFAALVKELRTTMDVAMAGVRREADPLATIQDELRARRERRRAG
jgi:hypothetical protein